MAEIFKKCPYCSKKIFNQPYHNNARMRQWIVIFISLTVVIIVICNVPTVLGQSSGFRPPTFKTARFIAGDVKDTVEITDEVISATIQKNIAECDADVSSRLGAGKREISVSISGRIGFKYGKEQPLRLKIYRSATSGGNYRLILNQLLKDFNIPPPYVAPLSSAEALKTSLAQMKEAQKESYSPGLHRAIVSMEQRLKLQEARDAAIKNKGGRVAGNGLNNFNQRGASLLFYVTDNSSLDCGSNNVFYKVKLCSESGTPVIESKVMKVMLTPRAVMAPDRMSWTWEQFFPGKDKLDGALIVMDTKVSMPVSNLPVKGKFAAPLPERKLTNPPIYYSSHGFGHERCWRYSRNNNNKPRFALADAVEVRPIFEDGCLFEVNGDIILKSLKIDGLKVGIQDRGRNAARIENGVRTTLKGYKIPLNYPGTPVAELEFEYEGKTNKLSFQLPPPPTGLRAELLDDGSVKLTWDSLTDRIDRKQMPAPPDIKLFRNDRLIYTCDINQTEFIDKQTEPGSVYTYSIMLTNADVKAQVWTKEQGLTNTKILLGEFKNPYPDKSNATVFIYPEKKPVRPVRVSFWEPALCYRKVGVAGMQLFSVAVQKLGEESDFEVLDRISRNNVIEEKILTMSYDKSNMIKILPADFTVMVRDYSRQEGNGVELWLIQNKKFDYNYDKSVNANAAKTYSNDNFSAWRIGSIGAEEQKIPERANALVDKLVAEIKQRTAFKGKVVKGKATVPATFVFNPLGRIRQAVDTENETKVISECIMVGLSNLLPGCSVMTRENWKTIFAERGLLQEHGENTNDDISGAVSIFGYVWQEKNEKHYIFIMTDIKNGICVGSLQCSGDIETVVAKLADVCKKINITWHKCDESVAQINAELNCERNNVLGFFLSRFGVINSRELHDSLMGTRELNRQEFAEKQWGIGKRDNAVKIMEELWSSDKSVWEKLEKYHCKMGNYTRALQIVEIMMQQPQAPNTLMAEYYRLRSMINLNAKPEIPVYERNINSSGMAYREGDYFSRDLDFGMEWDFDDGNQFMVKAYLAIAKNPDAKLSEIIKKPSAPFRFTLGTFWVERQNSKEEMASVTGREIMEVKFKKVIRKQSDPRRKINLADMICIDVMAQLGYPAAQRLLQEINAIVLPASFEAIKKMRIGRFNPDDSGVSAASLDAFQKMQAGNYDPGALVTFKAYKGDSNACKIALDTLQTNFSLGGETGNESVYYLMATVGRKDIIAMMLPKLDTDAKTNVSAIRWGNREMLKSLLLENPRLFDLDVYLYLIDGLNDQDCCMALFNHQMLWQHDSTAWGKSALWLGKSLPEYYRERTLNYKRKN